MTVAKLFYIQALSPLHPGVGQGIGDVDLPVARERATGVPYLPGSSLKGVLRDRGREVLSQEEVWALFGPEMERASEHAGALYVGDARLLLLPVRSLAGVFAHVTSPFLLKRLLREGKEAGLADLPVPEPALEEVLVEEETLLLPPGGEKAYLEDLDLKARKEPALTPWRELLGRFSPATPRRLALVHDDVMTFLMEAALEVVARVRLEDETKTVAQGALWYEENLPAETLLYGLFVAERSHRKGVELGPEGILERLKALLKRPLQLGGKATVGRGLAWVGLWEG